MAVFSTSRTKSDPEADLGFTPRRLGHVRGFDGIRGFGVLIVVIAHFNIILPDQLPRLLVVPGGVVSLDTFFVMSGFLITYLMLREQDKTGRVSSWAFYRRRALRLLPALGVFIVAYYIYSQIAGLDQQLVRSSLLSTAFYYTNWYLAFAPKNYLGGGVISEGLQHLWSLSFEEQFYLLWPIATIFLLTIRTRLRTVVIVLVSVIVIVALHRAQVFHSGLTGNPRHDNTVWYPVMIRTDTRVDSILVGALLAHLWIRNKIPIRHLTKAAWVAAGFLLICLPLVQVEQPFLYYGGISIIDLAIAIVLLAVVEGDWGGRHFFLLKPFLWLGLVSYGLYLWHLPILFGIDRYGRDWHPAIRVLVAVVLLIAFTLGSWFLVERPAIRWKDRLEARDAARRAEAILAGAATETPENARTTGTSNRTRSGPIDDSGRETAPAPSPGAGTDENRTNGGGAPLPDAAPVLDLQVAANEVDRARGPVDPPRA